jgi:predicted alpha/beta hydrolase family esterase
MTHKILMIQGAGEGAHDEDRALADYVETTLGSQYAIIYPEFRGLENVAYAPWREQISSELEKLGGDAIIVAHSLGGSALLKCLSEERAPF